MYASIHTGSTQHDIEIELFRLDSYVSSKSSDGYVLQIKKGFAQLTVHMDQQFMVELYKQLTAFIYSGGHEEHHTTLPARKTLFPKAPPLGDVLPRAVYELVMGIEHD